MQSTSHHSAARPTSWILGSCAVLLVAYYFWPASGAGEASASAPSRAAAAAPGDSAGPAGALTGSGPAGALPAGAYAAASNDGVRPVRLDANRDRILNAAGLPEGPALPSARRLPVKAAAGEIIGYRVDAQGVSHPLRAGDLKVVPNSPGTYAVVDMWGDSGYEVVAASVTARRSAPEPIPGEKPKADSAR